MFELILMFLLGLSVGACAVAIGTCTLAEKALKIIKSEQENKSAYHAIRPHDRRRQ